jgi:glycerate kinase
LLEGCPIVTAIPHPSALIPRRVLVVSATFPPELSAAMVASAIGRGLTAGGLGEPDLCPLEPEDHGGDVRGLLEALDLDSRIRRARAVVLAGERLSQQTLVGSVSCEVATRARQAGVPAYAVTRENSLDLFQARILDLQMILQAGTPRTLAAAGSRLALSL